MTPLTMIMFMLIAVLVILIISTLYGAYKLRRKAEGKCIYIITKNNEFYIEFECVICGSVVRVNKWLEGTKLGEYEK